jgi:RNA polymerase sigma factor (sigma-70 family)
VVQGSLQKFIHQIRDLGDTADLSDAQLLERFATRRDGPAFAALIKRHGAMVFGVCRRLLRHEQDAEDAFQATFVVLARKAASRRWHDSVGAFLYAVANRVALKARTLAKQRRIGQTEMHDVPAAQSVGEEPWRELWPLLDKELSRLPEKYRAPLVLCYLEGMTNEEAAQQLGRPVGTVCYHLSRGREMLKRHLMRRGLGLSAVGLAEVISHNATAAVPEALLALTLRAGLAAARLAGAVCNLTPPIAALVKGVLHEMLLTRLKIVMAAVLVLSIAGLGAGAVAYRVEAPNEQATPKLGPAVATGQAKLADRGPKDAKPQEKGKVEPMGVPLEARLVARKTTYTLDRGGKTPEEYAKRIEATTDPRTGPWVSDHRDQSPEEYARLVEAESKAAEKGVATPQVDLILELHNTSDKEIRVLIGGDIATLILDLKGPGTLSFTPDFARDLYLFGGTTTSIAPGKNVQLPITRLMHGHRRNGTMTFWTKPGEYTLTATYETFMSPIPKGAKQDERGVQRGFGRVAVTSAPVKLTVVDKK